MFSGFTIVERFGPRSEGWAKYVEFSRLTHVTEVVTLDSLLCPCVLHDARDEAWSHYVPEIPSVSAFDDLAWLLERHQVAAGEQVLKVVLAPDSSAERIVGSDEWQFVGLDLIEKNGSISALTNCGGGFDDVVEAADLNRFGLVSRYVDAVHIQKELRVRHPDDPHADCAMLAVWRRHP